MSLMTGLVRTVLYKTDIIRVANTKEGPLFCHTTLDALSDSDAQRRLIVDHRRGRRGGGLGRRTILSPLLSLNTLTHIQIWDATPRACVLLWRRFKGKRSGWG
jgi:hypothetical protein